MDPNLKSDANAFVGSGVSLAKSGFAALRRRIWLVVLLVALAGGTIGYALRSTNTGSEPPNTEEVGAGAATATGSERNEPSGSTVANKLSNLFTSREYVTIPAGTRFAGSLSETVSTKSTPAGERIRVRLTEPVVINKATVVPAGSNLVGTVAESKRSGRIKGRAQMTLRFTKLETPTGNYDIAASPIHREAKGTKKRDAAIIGIGAGVGSVIGALAGGGKGAAIGAGAGGGAGTGIVLATRGKETGFSQGESLAVRLVEPVRVEVAKT